MPAATSNTTSTFSSIFANNDMLQLAAVTLQGQAGMEPSTGWCHINYVMNVSVRRVRHLIIY